MENLVSKLQGREGCCNSIWRFVVHLLLFLSLREKLIPAAAQLPPEASSAATDLEALVQFRSSVNNIFLFSNWTGSTFCSNWHGVSCDSGGRVVKLLLNSTWGSLVGNIPPSLQNLTSLEQLDLHDNLLSGSIPLSVLNFSRLAHLDLGHNLLTGSIPNSMCGPSSSISATLQFLSLANNNLTGLIPENLQGCLNLTWLYLGGNMLSGQIPDSLGRLANLSTLDISFNNLTGSIPSLPKSLVFLTLKNNMLTGNLSELSSNLPEPLQLLSLSTNRLQGEIPAGVGKLPNLIRLELNENQLLGSIPDTWLLSSPLDTLDFSENNLSGVIPSSIYNLRVLTILQLQSNSLSGSISPSIESMENLTILNLAHNLLSGEIPPGIVNLRFVSILDLSWNQLTGSVPEEFMTSPWWQTAIVSTDNNPGLLTSSDRDTTPTPTSPADGKSWTLTMILVIDSIIALVDAYGLYAYWRLPKQQREEKIEPLYSYQPSLEYAVTVHELRKATNNFHEDNVVGRGARSVVYKGTVGSGQIAVKVLRMENAEKNRETLLRELETLGRVRHRNVLRILAVCSDLDTKALVLEYMPFSSLEFYLYKMVGRACLSWDTRFNILVGVAQGLVYLHQEHQEPIVHCDLKPSNILLDSDFEPKVADFGIAKHVHPGSSGDASMSGLCGTIGYIPPEYAWASSASTKGDVFSFGVVLLETLTARRPCDSWAIKEGQPGSLAEFVAFSYPEKIMSILDPNMVALELDGEIHEHEVRLVLQIGLLCTQVDSRKRPDMRDVLNMLTQIKIRRFTSLEIHRYRNVDELAHLPSTWDTPDDPTKHILQTSEEIKLDDWIARRITR